jgi:hypothetical protein
MDIEYPPSIILPFSVGRVSDPGASCSIMFFYVHSCIIRYFFVKPFFSPDFFPFEAMRGVASVNGRPRYSASILS